jgi:hypothetical protein
MGSLNHITSEFQTQEFVVGRTGSAAKATAWNPRRQATTAAKVGIMMLWPIWNPDNIVARGVLGGGLELADINSAVEMDHGSRYSYTVLAKKSLTFSTRLFSPPILSQNATTNSTNNSTRVDTRKAI